MSSGVSSVGSIGGKPVSGVPAADDVSCQGSGLRDSGSSEDQVGDSPYGFQEGMGEEIFSARERQSAALLPPLSPFASGTEYSDLSSSATTRKHGGSEQKGGAGASAGQGDAGADAQTTTSGGAGGTAPAQSGGTTGTGAGGAGGGGDDRPPQKPAPSDDRPEPSPKRRKLAGEDSDKGGAGVAQHVPGDNGTPVSSDDEDEEDDEGPADGAGGSGALQGGGGPPAKGATTAPVAAGTAQETLATVARDSGHGPSTGPATVARDSGHGPSAGPADAARETQAGSSGPDDDSGSSEQWLEDIKRAVTHPSEMVHVIDFKGGRFRHLLYDPAKTVYVELQTWEAAVPTDVSRRAEQLDRVTADQARGAPSAPGVDARSSGPAQGGAGAGAGEAAAMPPPPPQQPGAKPAAEGAGAGADAGAGAGAAAVVTLTATPTPPQSTDPNRGVLVLPNLPHTVKNAKRNAPLLLAGNGGGLSVNCIFESFVPVIETVLIAPLNIPGGTMLIPRNHFARMLVLRFTRGIPDEQLRTAFNGRLAFVVRLRDEPTPMTDEEIVAVFGDGNHGYRVCDELREAMTLNGAGIWPGERLRDRKDWAAQSLKDLIRHFFDERGFKKPFIRGVGKRNERDIVRDVAAAYGLNH